MNGLSRQRPWVIAAALCVLATAAIVITVPNARRHGDVPASASLAPKLASLSDQQLAELLPKSSDFPASWTVSDIKELSDTFGYFRYHVSDEGLGFSPAECYAVVGVASTGAFDAAEVFGHDPADPAEVADRRDIRLMVGREFDFTGFDAFTGLVSRCLRFSSAVGSYTVRIVEDSHPAGGPQRFRYSITATVGGEPEATRTDFYSYARSSGLILSGTASTGHQQPFDALFDGTLRRISNR
ncbi:hypothetical protein B1987_00880 [Mycobacterium kansasii]|uniref:Uncharacterized protein n=1 Tax=Mycobacterium attenuatum TaxID=2341086 RepID=A0A498Q274_9MYCO|nr:hypothetical protein [Mycobacterium attenuatum]ORB82653.1 hypothetical protein B1987_00880 [Mycobacterium kansasii]VBA39397.1 hypothetical protein LAUMK136_02973 [Mycobacterium attenuatum]VBA53885.1 hypothetical protein LAUMK191_02946 [Mycobacterium attenuatum]VBA58547.1 hypothetical protein LAUMK41_03024 [Mycobacterium attenuatum]